MTENLPAMPGRAHEEQTLMDIDYLLFLQRLRENTNNALTPFMKQLSLFAVTFLILIPVFLLGRQ